MICPRKIFFPTFSSMKTRTRVATGLFSASHPVTNANGYRTMNPYHLLILLFVVSEVYMATVIGTASA